MNHTIDLPEPPFPRIDSSTYRLEPDVDYVDESYEKTGIVLHHTVGGSASSTYNWWKQTDSRVGTAYVIDKGGKKYEFFPDDRWAWHIGRTSNENERRTIGIEIVSEGGLVKDDTGQYLKYYNPNTERGYEHDEALVDLGQEWRGYRYFDEYDKEQIKSTIILVHYLLEKYNIPKRMPKDLWNYKEDLKEFKGVVSHAQIRPDKTDVHPKFPIDYVARWCKLDLV